MILKELDPFPTTTDPRLRAGREAEEQMAFYLRREFGRSEQIFVFNGLRLETENDAAQIDHLILHKGGFVIVESKSVHGRIRVNDHGEWSRVYGSRQEGMPSPILQAKRQRHFLLYLLDDNAPALTGKALGLVQMHFGNTAIDCIVAISDSGIIERPKGNINLPELCKADLAPELIRKRIELQVKECHLLHLASVFESRGRGLSKSEVESISRFLLDKHKPHTIRPVKETSLPSLPDANLPFVSPRANGEPMSNSATDEVPAELSPPVPAEVVCAVCSKPVSEAVQKYCEDNRERFGGAIYCYIHQKRRRAT